MLERAGAALAAPFNDLRARLAARPDTEHEQGILRLILCSLAFLYLLPSALAHRDAMPLYVMSVICALALLIFLRIAYSTNISPGKLSYR